MYAKWQEEVQYKQFGIGSKTKRFEFKNRMWENLGLTKCVMFSEMLPKQNPQTFDSTHKKSYVAESLLSFQYHKRL